MISIRKFYIAFITVAILFFYGCSVNAVVTDVGKASADVSAISVGGKGYISVLLGNSILNVKLSNLKVFRIQRDKTRNFHGNSYSLAEVILYDGTKFGTFDDKSTRERAYVRSDVYLSGKLKSGGNYKAILNEITTVDFPVK